jgi:hypothetical protein
MASVTVDTLLREAAELKIDELNRSKQAFKMQYYIGTLCALNPRADGMLRERATAFLQDTQRLDPSLEDDDDLKIISRFIEQTTDDSLLSGPKLLKYERQLLSKLEKHVNRYDITSLHMDLMTEAMDASQNVAPVAAKVDATTLDDGFELVENDLEDLLEKFESETFTAKHVDEEKLEAYLEDLTKLSNVPDSSMWDPLNKLRRCMKGFGQDFLDGDITIEDDEMMWCITDLLKNDLISNEKKKTLERYIQSPIAAKELLATLNTKSIQHWNWRNADKGLPVTARQDSEGQYHMTVEEDLVTMLFLHCVSMIWAQKLKKCLSDFFENFASSIARTMSADDLAKQQFFLNQMPSEIAQGQGYHCQTCYTPYPPPPPPPDAYMPPPPPPPGYDNVVVIPKPRKVKKKIQVYCPPPPPPPPPVTNFDTVDYERKRNYSRDFLMSRLPSQDGCGLKLTSPEKTQANLIKTLFAEMKLRTAFDGGFGHSVIDFHSLASSLPHQTVLVVLRFLGVPDIWVDFFARFLAANLNIGPAVRGAPDRVLTRARGVPKGHGLELLFSEAVMFFAELAVYKKTGLFLYRLGSKCYFVGTEEQRKSVDLELSIFSKRTALDFDNLFTVPSFGIRVGFLWLNNTATTVPSMIDAYAYRVKEQLAATTAVFEWVRVWNRTVGTYAAHLFGPLGELFGDTHLGVVKTAYKRIFDIILEDGNLTEHVIKMLRTRSNFAEKSPPLLLETFIYLPQAFGGLGLKTPFITFTLARNTISSPEAEIQKYLDVETHYHTTALRNWSDLKPLHISKKLSAIFNNDDDAIAAALGKDHAPASFLPMSELTKHREYALFPPLPDSLLQTSATVYKGPPPCPYLTCLYRTLLREPVDDIIASERVMDDVRRLHEHRGTKRWSQLDAEEKWVLQFYGDECFERFGTLEAWVGEFVPKRCLEVVMGWDENEGDWGSSYGSGCSSVA